MPNSAAAKAKKRARKVPAKRAAVTKGAATAAPRDRLVALEEECARLKSELATARARFQELEAQREALVNRIDWVIDSLHTLTEE